MSDLGSVFEFDYDAMRAAIDRRPLRYIEVDTAWREQDPPRGKSAQLLKRFIAGRASLLDVGGGDGRYEDILRKLGFTGVYKTVDPNRHHPQDYRDIDDVAQPFESVLMFELLEHLPLPEVMRHLRKAHEILAPGGVLAFSTPNTNHANHFWRIDVTHIRPLPPIQLSGLIRTAGFDRVEMYRQYLKSGRKRAVVRPLTKLLAWLLEVDHAQSILGFAWKH